MNKQFKQLRTILGTVAVCVAVIGCLTGCRSSEQDLENLQLLRRIPIDAVTVIAAKPRAILESKFVNSWPGFAGKKESMLGKSQEFRNKLGIDPYLDIKKVVIFTSDFRNSFEQNWAVILQGNFTGFFLDSITVHKEVRDSLEEIAGFKVHCLTVPEDSSSHTFFLYHDSGEMLFSINRTNMRNMLELKQGTGKNLTDNDGLVDRILDLEYHNQLWFMVPTKGLMNDVLEKIRRKKADFNSELLDIASIQGGMNLDSELGINVQANCSSQEPVKLLFDTLNGFLAMGKLSLGALPETRAILDKVKISQDGETLSVSLSLQVADIQNLKNIKDPASLLGNFLERQLAWLDGPSRHDKD